MCVYPTVTEQDLISLSKLAEQQKIEVQLKLKTEIENKLMIKNWPLTT